ncbi:hypothetical protein BZL30_1540 [Mycobacterium kansasii]|uniref:DUF3499 domain-containing protein n=1 Tax=Mycobacterium kansasii TaxID=1768 RepID=A0A1V3XTL9_MYCKA|nr:hypothetical protein BZL30_1540 [Mycobacterium kansasii]
MATLTFVYSDSTAVVGPLATAREPHSWDLCVSHAGRITAPRGWELVRHAGPLPTNPDEDDLVALADAVREGGPSLPAPIRWPTPAETARRTMASPIPWSTTPVFMPVFMPRPPVVACWRRPNIAMDVAVDTCACCPIPRLVPTGPAASRSRFGSGPDRCRRRLRRADRLAAKGRRKPSRQEPRHVLARRGYQSCYQGL